jgi:valyl-tRNA synthetase
VRSRYSVPPRTLLNVIVRAGGAEGCLLTDQADIVRSLAGIGTLTVDAGATKPAHASVAVAAGSELYIPLEGLVDFAHERARVAKELDAAQADLEKLARKLGNEGFLAKASADIIEKDRARSVELADSVAKLTAQLAELAD